MAKRKSDVGTLYKGSPGQWSWLLHRITGVAVILFLFAHVVDTAVVGWGPEAYNRVVSVYHNWVVKLLELGSRRRAVPSRSTASKICLTTSAVESPVHETGIALKPPIIFLSACSDHHHNGQGILECRRVF